jgi:copper chaperone
MIHIFEVTGMTCSHCERAITQAILQSDPQAEVKIDRAINQVEVQSQQSHEVLTQTIEQEGYVVVS